MSMTSTMRALLTDITGAESLDTLKLLELKHDREEYRILCHWRAITARRLKAPAPHRFHGGLVQLRVSPERTTWTSSTLPCAVMRIFRSTVPSIPRRLADSG